MYVYYYAFALNYFVANDIAGFGIYCVIIQCVIYNNDYGIM